MNTLRTHATMWLIVVVVLALTITGQSHRISKWLGTGHAA